MICRDRDLNVKFLTSQYLKCVSSITKLLDEKNNNMKWDISLSTTPYEKHLGTFTSNEKVKIE